MIKAPTIPAKPLLSVIDADALQAEAHFEQAVFEATDAIAVVAPNMSFDEVRLERVVAIEAKLEKIGCSDVVLQHCDLSAARMSEGSSLRVQYKHVRLTGTDFSVSTLKDVVFEDCKLDMANFRSAKLVRVTFKHCTLIETDFQSAVLHHVTFEDCVLEKTAFDHIELKDVDARSSQLFDIRGWNSLKGLTIDHMQLASIAPQLALELGLKIEN